METVFEWLNPLVWLDWAQDHPSLSLAIGVPIAAFVIWRLVRGDLGVRRAIINVVGILLVVWGVQSFADWVKPSLTPQDLFIPPVVGPQAVKAVLVQQGPILRTVTYTGIVHPYERVVLRARSDGFVKDIAVYPGDRVDTGTVVVRLETSELQPKLEEASAQLNYLQEEFRRDERLFSTGAISASQFELSRTRMQAAAATVALLRTEIGYASVRAPSDGWVSKRAVDPGQYVRKGDHLLAYDRLGKVRIRFHVAVEDLVTISAGTEIILEFPGLPSGRLSGAQGADQSDAVHDTGTMKAEVTSVFPRADERSRLGVVEVAVDNPDLIFKSDTYVIGHFVTGWADNAWVVPAAALTPMPGGKTVIFVAPAFADQGAAEMHEVKVGLRNGVEVQILEGLSEPAYVIVAGNRSLTEGQTVVVVAREGGF